MDITKRINEMRIEIITTKNYEPKNIYMGEKELKLLIDWAMDTYGFEQRPKSSAGLEFLGMKIYEVKKESHLNVA